MPVTINLQKPVAVDNGVLLVAFPSVGLVSTIAANYLIHQLQLELVGALVSRQFPLASIVREGAPVDPVRIYSGKGLVIVVSEFRPPPHAVGNIAEALAQWEVAQRCRLVVSSEGIPPPEETTTPEECQIFGVGSTMKARELLGAAKVPLLHSGMVTGLSAHLLNEGARNSTDIVCLIAEAHRKYPDARAGARLVEAIDRMLPEIALDTKPLYEEAARIDQELQRTQKARTVVEKGLAGDTLPPGMYG